MVLKCLCHFQSDKLVQDMAVEAFFLNVGLAVDLVLMLE